MILERTKFIAGLLEECPFSMAELRAIISSAPSRYKVYSIPKRKPGTYRAIAQPAVEVKVLQRWITTRLIATLPVHKAAMAYRPNIGIRENALAHRNSHFILKADFENFFHSIKAPDINRLLRVVSDLTSQDIEAIIRIVTWRNKRSGDVCLAIGAPSSPAISNAVMYEFDCRLFDYCREKNIVYTRYADDLALSTNSQNVLSEALQFIKGLLGGLESPRLRLNSEKTTFISSKHSRKITGLVVSNESNVTLGRTRRRQVRAMVDHAVRGNASIEALASLRGTLAFLMDADPDYFASLQRKYGKALVSKLLA